MEWLDILRLIETGERASAEFKQGFDLSAIGKAICAFANSRGGVIVLGVNNAQQIVGIRNNPESVQERVTSFLHTGCSAPVSARCGSHQDPGGWVHWIEVPRQRGFEPRALRRAGVVGVRRQRSTVEPSPTELQELYNVFGYVLTEERAIQPASPDDIDIQSFRGYLQAIGIDTVGELQPNDTDDLRNRGVLTLLGETLHPTLYGVLAFGRQPQRYPQTRNFRIECVAYDGNDRAAPVVQVADARGCSR